MYKNLQKSLRFNFFIHKMLSNGLLFCQSHSECQQLAACDDTSTCGRKSAPHLGGFHEINLTVNRSAIGQYRIYLRKSSPLTKC